MVWTSFMTPILHLINFAKFYGRQWQRKKPPMIHIIWVIFQQIFNLYNKIGWMHIRTDSLGQPPIHLTRGPLTSPSIPDSDLNWLKPDLLLVPNLICFFLLWTVFFLFEFYFKFYCFPPTPLEKVSKENFNIKYSYIIVFCWTWN